jgi:cytochrome c oxidase assembly protein subunit 15
MTDPSQLRISPWPHRLAVALALVTFPLIWVGGLVTTYDAGMAVPDWPSTYGYNLLLYPWQSWLAAPWDLFIEHGHRLLGALAGLLCLALVAVAYFSDGRRWLRGAAIGALALVILQGVLGGARVLLDARLVALLHGCVGPLFFAYLAALTVMTARSATKADVAMDATGRRLVSAPWMMTALAYLQIVLGAMVRHVPLAASPQWFRAALFLHLLMAGWLTFQIMATTVLVVRAWSTSKQNGFLGPAALLCGLVIVQLGLGIGTYIVKYSWPAWMSEYSFAATYVVEEKGLLQSMITTAHVANGSLILFASMVLATRASRPALMNAFCRSISAPLLAFACLPGMRGGLAG